VPSRNDFVREMIMASTPRRHADAAANVATYMLLLFG
jgi:hypothetical protein